MPADELVLAGATAALVAVAVPALRFALRRRGERALADDLAMLRWPVRVVALCVFLRIAVGDRAGSAEPLLTAAFVAAAAWVATRFLLVGQRLLGRRLRIDASDNLRARSRMTQVELVRRVITSLVVGGAVFVVIVVATPLRGLGPSLLAYASVIGVILGLALRAPLENLMAGIMVALTEPIRLDDVVVVEGQWGRIEQVGLVNVIVRAWDDRRIVLPTSYFVGTAFENWTRHTAQITGTIMLWVDYGVDVADLRREFELAVAASTKWDGRTCVLQVTELGERAVQLRGIATAADAPSAWDLRCEVREHLLRYLALQGTAPVALRLESPVPAR